MVETYSFYYTALGVKESTAMLRKNMPRRRICGSPIRSNGGRKFGSRSPLTDVGQSGFNSLLLGAGCLSNLFTSSGKRYSVIELPAVKPHPSTYRCGILSGRRLRY